MSNSGHIPFHIDRLIGRDNYASWKFAVQAYFEPEEFWTCVTGTNIEPKKETKAKIQLILMLDPTHYVYVQSATTFKEVWENLEQAFDDSGLYRRVALLRDLITTTLESSRSVDDYVNKIMTTAHKLRNRKFDIIIFSPVMENSDAVYFIVYFISLNITNFIQIHSSVFVCV